MSKDKEYSNTRTRERDIRIQENSHKKGSRRNTGLLGIKREVQSCEISTLSCIKRSNRLLEFLIIKKSLSEELSDLAVIRL